MEKPMPEPYLVITAWPDLDGARQQARTWVEKKLAASVNLLPIMDSIMCLVKVSYAVAANTRSLSKPALPACPAAQYQIRPPLRRGGDIGI